MKIRSGLTAILLIFVLGLLSACDSSEERAEKHFQSALTLLAAGDADRAIVEFKNVFKLNGRHRLARSKYAALLRQRGNTQAAAGQYLRLVEQYPDDFVGQRAIAEIYAEQGNWEEMKRYLNAAIRLQPKDTTTLALQLFHDYGQSIDAKAPEGTMAVIAQVEMLLPEIPENILLRQILIDNHMRLANFSLALAEIDRSLNIAPDDRGLHNVRLSVLASLGDGFGVEAQLKEMIDNFPEDETSLAALVRWYVSQGQLDEAENYLRLAAEKDGATTEDKLTLVRFLSQLRSEKVALSELNQIIEAGDSDLLLLGLRAGYEFDLGNHDLAIEQMREILDGSESSDVSRRITIALSRMLEVTGNSVGARALIEQVLEENSANVAALKIKADWLIDSDQVGEAILALRSALDEAPQDADIFTLLARAHERDGNQDLIAEMLSLALDAANGAPQESVRYAKYLIKRNKLGTAEGILIDSLKLSPGNLPILIELGNLYIKSEDWPRAEQVRATLGRLDSQSGTTAGNNLKSRILQRQQKLTESVEFLESLLNKGAAGFGAHIAIVGNFLRAREFDQAKTYVANLKSGDPDNPAVRFLDASVDLATGDVETAELKYRELVDEDSNRSQVWVALYRLLVASDRSADAAATIDEARLTLADDPTLKWIKAGILEADGDMEGAISLYEEMYVVDSSNLIIANNLASLLTTTYSDPASLERAAAIGKRLRNSRIPPYQDTYGWIAHLRGNVSESLKALEPAAKALGADPMVQYHLAQAYLAAEEPADALIQFEKVVELTGAADTRDFVVLSRTEVNRLKAEQSSQQSE
ncbi:MAG: tetratricopeptide repeat protein [Paracoccaceae bacterium]